MVDINPRKKKGPVYDGQGIAYDYIVIIDAGSKGSRVYVYNWLNPSQALAKNADLSHPRLIKLLDRTTEDMGILDDRDDDTDTDGDGDDGNQPDTLEEFKLPKISTKKKWKTKIKPGISTFDESPQKIGKHHLKYLLKLAEKVVPNSQHYRTPIFLHSTAGMRLLTPTNQQTILDEICTYFSQESNFFLPDCSSHINVIEGDIEGLYGWLASNYLMGSFDHPLDHQHGKHHTTYGLLDMGGASTQVVFQPNTTEIEEHENKLYKLDLFEVPKLTNDVWEDPHPLNFNVYSDSYLGLGMTQAYEKYLKSLVENSNSESLGFLNYRPPITDPCLPKGYTTSTTVNDQNYDFTGDSDFHQCLQSMFPVLSKGSYGHSDKPSGNCQQYNDQADVSSCLLNDLIPAFDFDINYFLGVSGYWYATSKLMEYNDHGKRDAKNVHKLPPQVSDDKESINEQPDNDRSSTEQSTNEDKTDNKSSDYNYKTIYENTSKLCSKSYSELIQLNELKSKEDQLSMDELSNLCFKSSWILNFLHVGLGFPRFGIDEVKSNEKFKSLQFVDDINGKEFSWTLGRALLYANDEYIQAYNNFTNSDVKRAGFTYSASPNIFHYGSEQNHIRSRPAFDGQITSDTTTDYDSDDNADYNELKWYIKPHRWYGIGIIGVLLLLIFWLLIGKHRRSKIVTITTTKLKSLKNMTSRVKYTKVREDLEIGDFELNDLENQPSGSVDQFVISDDEGGSSENTIQKSNSESEV